MSLFLATLDAVTSVISDGTYPVRFFLASAWVGTLALVGYCLRSRTLDSRVFFWSRALGTIALALMFLLTGLMQYALHRTYEVPLASVALYVEGEDITGTRMTHMHTGKAALGALPGAERFSGRADTGSALDAFIAPLYAHALLLLAGILLMALIAAYAGMVRTLQASGRVIPGTALYALLSFVVIEKTVDGGIVSDAALLASVLYLALLWLPARMFFSVLFYGLIAQSLILAAAFALGGYAPSDVIAASVRAALLALIAAALHLSWTRPKYFGRRIMHSAAFLACGAFVVWQGIPDWTYLRTSLAADSVLIAYPNERLAGLAPDGSIGGLGIYRLPGTPDTAVQDAVDRYDLPYWYRPIGCIGGADSMARREFTVVSPKELADPGIPHASLEYQPQGTTSSGWFRYGGVLTAPECLARRTDVLKELLHLSGAETGVIYDIRTYAQQGGR